MRVNRLWVRLEGKRQARLRVRSGMLGREGFHEIDRRVEPDYQLRRRTP